MDAGIKMIASSVIKWYPDKTIYGVFDGRYKHAQMPVYPYLFVNDVVMVGYDIYSEVKGVVSVEKTDLLSTPSLGITGFWNMVAGLILRLMTFNSLSRDHRALFRDFPALRGFPPRHPFAHLYFPATI